MAGVAIKGYRAPSYSIGRDTLWALEVLQEEGHTYSSSIYPIQHDHYGMPEAPRFAFRTRPGGLLELPVTTVEVAGRQLPCGGGGYFRLLPYRLCRWALRRVNAEDQRAGIFYFHPWEIDPDQPRIANASLKSRLRHYVNLSTMEQRLERLLRDFQWGRMDEVFGV
jgi:polysaccharide deacetylase family protein (PEP-CTERM system associated)